MTLSNLRIRQLINPSTERLATVAFVLDKAFAGDPFAETCLGGQKELSFRFHLANVAACSVGGGELWVAELPNAETPESQDGEIVGVACWYGPGETLFARPEARAAGWDQVAAAFSPDLQVWWSNYFVPKNVEQCDALLGKDAKLHGWYLMTLAVVPERHNQGVGRALVEDIKERARVDGKNICLQAAVPNNVEIYKKMGFQDMGSEQYESPFTSGFRLWNMMLPAPSD